MAIEITPNLQQAISENEVQPVMVLEIGDFPGIFGSMEVVSFIRIGDPGLLIGDDWEIGGFRLLDEQSPFITFNTGTTTKITQRLDPSRGQGTSVSSMTVSLVDKDEQITRFVSPGFSLNEVLGKRATVYSGTKDVSFPEDYNVVFRGIVQYIDAACGLITLGLSSTEEQKRAALLTGVASDLTANVEYLSNTLNQLFFKNREDNPVPTTVVLTTGAPAPGSEIVTVVGSTITVNVNEFGSTANQVKRAIEDDPDARFLIEVSIRKGGDGNAVQGLGSVTLGIDTTVDVTDGQFFLAPADAGTLRTYVKVGEELIEYTGKTVNTLTGCVRGSEGTTPATHETGAEVKQVLRLSGNGIDLALKLMLSGGPAYYASALLVSSINYLSPSENVPNTFFFGDIDLKKVHGVSIGDRLTCTLDSIPGNNVTDALIIDVGPTADGGSFITVDAPLSDQIASSGEVKIKSQFNVLPIGLKLLPSEVDVDQHLQIRDTYLPAATLDIITDTIPNGKDFLDREIYLQMTCYSIPRAGRASVTLHVAPLPFEEVPLLDLSNVKNPGDLRVLRSTSENFFNQVIFNYNYNVVTNQYASVFQLTSEESLDRIPALGLRPFIITSKGLRQGSIAVMQRASERYLKRYQFGAELIRNVKLMYKAGYKIQIADIVAVDFKALKISDFSTGTRAGEIRLFEVLNKIIDNKTGDVSLDLVSTIFGRDDRYGLFSPASKVAPGSTLVKILLKKSFGTKPYQLESFKWNDHIGQSILIHSPDWSTQYTSRILGFDFGDPQGMLIEPIAGVPGEDWIVRVINYPASTDPAVESHWKSRYAFFSPQFQVVAGINASSFDLASADVARLRVGASLRVHNLDFSDDSGDVKIESIVGDTVNVTPSLGFTPNNTHLVDLVNFPDGTPAYRFL